MKETRKLKLFVENRTNNSLGYMLRIPTLFGKALELDKDNPYIDVTLDMDYEAQEQIIIIRKSKEQ